MIPHPRWNLIASTPHAATRQSSASAPDGSLLGCQTLMVLLGVLMPPMRGPEDLNHTCPLSGSYAVQQSARLLTQATSRIQLHCQWSNSAPVPSLCSYMASGCGWVCGFASAVSGYRQLAVLERQHFSRRLLSRAAVRGLQVFLISTAACLAGGRFGLAPTAKKHTHAGLRLYDEDSEGLTTNDPAGVPPPPGGKSGTQKQRQPETKPEPAETSSGETGWLR